ncbi:MAG: hypothetical protein ACR2KT_08515 [Methylocella sp.]|nr:MAG: hypothetical protein DLM68_12750 [Hyphomicrobiales bacterium]
MAGRSLFPHAFGLENERPLWTPRSLDRCLFLALVYPIAMIFVIWAVAGNAGPAEMALGLKPDVSGLARSLVAAAAIFVGFVLWSFFRRKGRNSSVWGRVTDKIDGVGATAIVAALIALGTVGGATALTAFGFVGAGAVAFGVAVVGAVASTNRVAGAVTVATAVPIAFGLAFGLGGEPQSIVAVVVAAAATATLGILLLCWIAIKCGAQGVFLFFFIPAAIMACLAAVNLLLPLTTWRYTGPLLLFQGLLTLINAPFNWASVGLTRALLRRGLELKGWWPYFLAFINVLLTTAIVAALALAMVIAIQAFNEVVAHGVQPPMVPRDLPFEGIALGGLFEGISKNPAAPEYWWIYALLLATMIPSLISLMIGGASLTSGIPGLPSLLLRFMPEGKVEAWNRTWLAVVLTAQLFLGATLGVVAGAFLVVALSVYVMPDAGLSLLEQARAVAALDLPAQVGAYLARFL